MKQLSWIGLSLLAMLVLHRMTAARVERAETEIATLKQAMAALSQKGSRGDDAAWARAIAPVHHMEISDPPPIPRPSTEPPSSQVKARETTYGDQLAYYQASLEAEPVDATWSRSAAQRLRGIFDQIRSGATTVRSVECRQTICRGELAHDSEAESQAFLEKWMYSNARLEWQGPVTAGVASTDRDGNTRSVFYFAREGTELPEVR